MRVSIDVRVQAELRSELARLANTMGVPLPALCERILKAGVPAARDQYLRSIMKEVIP